LSCGKLLCSSLDEQVKTTVTRETISPEKLGARSTPIVATCPSIHVYYLTGPVFFGSVTTILEAFETAHEYQSLIISMRGVPLIDVMGAQVLRQIVEEHQQRRGDVYVSALQPGVRKMFKRTGLIELLGENNIYWSSSDIIVALHEQRLTEGCPHCHAQGEKCAVWQAARRCITDLSPAGNAASPTPG
jgi:SulP family sulfate permease